MTPQPAFSDASWLAVPGAIDDGLLRALELSDAREVPWETGLTKVLDDYEYPILSHVFAAVIHQRGAQWTCAVGDWFGDTGDDSRAVEACVAASRVRGEAFAFTTHGRMDWYAWMHAREGELVRRVVYAEGGLVVNEGIHVERAASTRVEFSEQAIGAIASRRAVGPMEFADAKSRGGVLAVTREGRERRPSISAPGD